jgi:hypothetical protein
MLIRLLSDLGIDLAALIALLSLYTFRHRSRDLVLAYAALNVGVFVVVAMLAAQRVDFAVGFGLFGILSIIRLRSSAITQEEVAYYFVALTLGLVNGLHPSPRALQLVLVAVLLTAPYLAGHPRLLPRARRQSVTLDAVHPDEPTLRADLERRLGGRVRRCDVSEIDYVREVTIVDVRFDAATPVRRGMPHQVTR